MKKIIVAGAGHGGIAAACLLSKGGFDVTVYERNSRENMGYDWTDIFDPRGFSACNIPMPAPDKYKQKNNMTFFPPTLKNPITQQTQEGKFEIQMERRDIYAHLIEHAEKCGVKFEWETTVTAPVFTGNRVTGIKTDKGEIAASLVIDACGVYSPLRKAMPYYTGIQKMPRKNEYFNVYRAFYERTDSIPEDNFRVLLMHRNILGISWVATEEEHTDILIGRFDSINEKDVEDELESLRLTQPSLGEKLLRGGSFVTIPVRQPLGVLVADGYAAIGDSAFMTVPLIGSGIANSMKAARLLADAVMKDVNREFSASTLWEYQKSFYRTLGSGLAPIAPLKLLLTKITPDDVNYVFDRKVFEGKEVTMDIDSSSIWAFASHINMKSLPSKGLKALAHPSLIPAVMWCGKKIAQSVAVCAAMPQSYDRDRVLKWVNAYNRVFETE